MNKIQQIYEFIDNAKLITIGYTHQSERLKDEFLSNISHIKIDDYDFNGNLTTYIREIKINNLLNDETNDNFNNTIVIDIGNVFIPLGEYKFKVIRKMINEIRDYTIRYNQRVIITSLTHRKMSTNTVGVDSSLIYSADLVMIINDSKLNIIKNRFNIEQIGVEL